MLINCKKASDFYQIIGICIGEGIKPVSLFVSHEPSNPTFMFDEETSSKKYESFTFALLTPQYTAIYSGLVKKEEFNNIFETIKELYQPLNSYIQIFDKVKYNSKTQCLDVESHIDTIQ